MKKLLMFAILLFWAVRAFAFEPLFATRIDYEVGYYPSSVFCADLDGDHDLDLALGNTQDSDSVSILLSNGDGTFKTAVRYWAGCYPMSVFCADLDGDLDLDLALGGWYTRCVHVLLNNGDGTFQSPVNYGAGDLPRSVFCADLDGDLDLDMAVANYESDNISILKNNGDGTFQTKVDYVTGVYPVSVFCADLDGDSALDLAVANQDSESVSILKNNGDGTFQSAVNYLVGAGAVSVFCADLDGDGDLDLAVAGSDSVSILKNNGDGTYQTAVNYVAGRGPSYVFCADLDGDLDVDLAVANNSSDNVSVFFNNGDGTFQSAVSYEVGNDPSSVLCADLDGDLDLDVAVADWYSGDVSVLMNKGDGTFPTPSNYEAGYSPTSVFCADLNGDLDLDLAVANSDGNVSILLDNGDGSFQTGVDYWVGFGPASVFCADLDGDMDLDLAVAGGWNNVSILKNNGDGTFESAVNYGAGSWPTCVFCADLDGDGDLDLAVAIQGGGNVSILKNNGNGTFQSAVNYGAGVGASSVFCADLDGDTDLDLAVAGGWSNSISVLFNNGDGTFQPPVNYAGGDYPISVFSADLDGDSDLDLAVSNYWSDNISVLLNNGDGTFQTAVNYGAGTGPYSIFSADLDGDLDLDLAVANFSGNDVSILLNNGDATFQASVNYGVAIEPYSVFCADLDGDLDLDLAVANYGSNNVSILKNLGEVTFPLVSSLCPDKATNSDRMYTIINGWNYQAQASVKLARSGLPTDTIRASEVTVYPYTKIIARFDLAGQPTGTIWDLIVTNPTGAADTLFSAFRIVSPSELSPEDVLCVLSSNHERIQDFQANAKAWSKFNGQPLDSIIHSLSLYKSPDKVKNIDYANEDTTQVISTVINRGYLQYEIDPETGNAYETNLLQVANMTPSEFAGLNFYDPDNFLFHHYVTIKEIHQYPDSLTFVLEAIPKRAEWTYTKLELEIDYTRGLVVKSTVYSDTVGSQIVSVTEEQLIDGVWVGTKSIKTTADTSETLQTEIELSGIQINAGIPDSIFYPTKIKQVEVEPETTYQEVEMPPLPKYVSDQWKNPNVYKPNPILFLHGFALGNPKSWEKVMEKFNEYIEPYYATGPDCYVYCPDFQTHPGANASIDGPGGWGDSTCQNIIARLDTLSGVPIEYRPFKVNIVAHSAGGLGARECVTDPEHSGYYNLVDKIITTGTPHLGSELTYVGQAVVNCEAGLFQACALYPNPWIVTGTILGLGIIGAVKFRLNIDVAGEIEIDMTPGSIFYQNLYSRPQHEDKIKYYAISCTYPPGPWSGLLPGADDWVVSDSSQLGIGRPGDFDFNHYLAGYGRGRAKHWEGETDNSFGHIRRFLDQKPDVLITKPVPNDSIAEVCTLRVELHNEYLPASTQLFVTMTRLGDPPIADFQDFFRPDTSWRAVGPTSAKSGRYDTTIAVSKAPPGKYLITAKATNPAGFIDQASVEIILGVDLLTQIGGSQARRGFNKDYGVSFRNIGNAEAANITVEAHLPTLVEYVSSSPPGNLVGNTVTWNYPSLGAGESGNVSVLVHIPWSVPQGTWLCAISHVSTSDDDVDLTNNQSLVTDQVVGSYDPNDKKVEPAGVGDKGYIAEGQQLHYTVFFENDTTATADAINIVVVDTLNPNLNWNSLRFGPMSHPDKCSTSFDPVTGVITLECDSIMLPPDTLPPNGEGWFTFSVAPQYLQHGTEIKNRASIQFDVNPWMYAPMDSSYIVNTMDEYPPNSRVLPLWDTVSSLDFEVNWKGRDDSLGFGCGIRDYTIYVSDNGGPYEVWIADTSDTFATFHGKVAHSYCFYTIAEDSVGNLEEAPTAPDACTRTPTYIRGDVNSDGVINVTDVVYLINYLFINGPAPDPLAAGDVNCDSAINAADVVYLINYLFISGPPPGC